MLVYVGYGLFFPLRAPGLGDVGPVIPAPQQLRMQPSPGMTWASRLNSPFLSVFRPSLGESLTFTLCF